MFFSDYSNNRQNSYIGSLEEFTKTFTGLLEKYPAEVLAPIESLKNEISVEITDETVESI